MKSKPNQQSRRQFLRHSGAAVATLGGAGIAATNSASAEESEQPNGILADGIGVEGGDNWAFARGLSAFGLSTFSSSSDIEKLAEEIRNEFRANTEAWINYGNWLIEEYDDVQPAGSVTVQVDILKTHWIGDDERAETTIKATYDDEAEEYIDLTWELEAPDEADYTVTLQNSAADNADDELLEYRLEFIDEEGDDHDLPDEAYISRLAGKYAPAIALGEEGHSVLELLVGDLNVDDA